MKFKEWLYEAKLMANELRIEHSRTTERTRRGSFPAIAINAYLGDNFVGDLYLVNENGEWIVYGVNVLPDYQRKGIATHLYNYAEKLLNVKLKPSSSQTDYGKAFWQMRNQGQ